MVNVKILIVDDEIDYCMIMQNYFEEKGFEVYTAFTLNEGMQLLNEIKPSILFLDNNLPDGEGWAKLSEIVKYYPDLKIYLISAYGEKPELWRRIPNITFWDKPISTTLLDGVL